MTNKYTYFLKSNLVGISRLFVLVYSNQDANSKRFKAKRFYFRKGIVDNHNIIITGKAIDSDRKRYEEIRKSTTA